MFDFDAGKLIVIGAVALVVIGPKELPRVLRQVGQAVAKVRRMAADFQSQFMDAMREAEMADVKEEMSKIAESAKIDVAFDPVRDIRNQIGGAVSDGTATLKAAIEAPEATQVPHPEAGAERASKDEGEPTALSETSSFETPAAQAPQDEGREATPHPEARATRASKDEGLAEGGLVGAGVAPAALADPADANATSSEVTMEDIRRALAEKLDQPVKESAA